MSNTKNRTLYFDYLRILATIAVIVIHVTATELLNRSIDTYWHILNIFNGCSRFAVPVFFMISGALFLDNSRQISIKELYAKYILRLLVAYFFWSAVYALIYHSKSLGIFVQSVVSGHYHMWFVISIIGLYIITPLLRKITESRELTKYFLIISLALFLVPKFFILFSEKIPFPGSTFISELISDFLSTMQLRFIQGYSFYFVLGHYLHTTEFSKMNRAVIYILSLLSFALTIGFSSLLSVKEQSIVQDLNANTSVNIFFEAMGVFLFAKYELSRIRFSEKATTFITKVSKYTFGCYLMHVLVIDAFDRFLHMNAVYYNPILAVPFITIMTFVIATAVSALLNHIPVLKKYIV